MKLIFEKKIHSQRILNFAILFFVATITGAPFLASIGLACFILGSLIYIIFHKNSSFFNWQVTLLTVPFILYAISFRNTFGFDEPVGFLIRSLPILLVPIFLSLTNPSIPNQHKISYFYVIGLIFNCVLLFIIAFYFFVLNGFSLQFITYYKLASYLSLHPTYLSLYILIGIVLITKFRLFPRLSTIAFVLFFVIILILLQTRGVLLLFIIWIIIKFIRTFNWMNFVAFLAMILTLFFSILLLPKVQNRFYQLLELPTNELELIGNCQENGITQRVWLWSNALEQINDSPYFGFGFRSQNTLFPMKIHKKNLYYNNNQAYDEASHIISNFNLHNQYLQIFYESGGVGLFILFISIILVIKYAWIQKNTTFLVIYCMILIILFSENLLDRQMGIYLYSFILPLFFLSNSETSNYA